MHSFKKNTLEEAWRFPFNCMYVVHKTISLFELYLEVSIFIIALCSNSSMFTDQVKSIKMLRYIIGCHFRTGLYICTVCDWIMIMSRDAWLLIQVSDMTSWCRLSHHYYKLIDHVWYVTVVSLYPFMAPLYSIHINNVTYVNCSCTVNAPFCI